MYINKRVVCIGGGTGLSTLLRGLKEHTESLTAVVTVADNGGGSGVLRKELDMLPPGDIRNCIMALAETEPIMHDILQYRFKKGSLKGQNLGNLFLAAMTDLCGSFEKAVETANEVLAVKGQVLPVTTENIQLKAVYEDGSHVVGEHEIVYTNKVMRKKIDHVSLVPEKPKGHHKAIDAIRKADLIVLGPGSLFTSLIPNLLVEGISEAIRASFANVIYVGNIMTQPGESDGFSLKDHIEEIQKYLGQDTIEYIITNSSQLSDEIKEVYELDGAYLVRNDIASTDKVTVIEADLAMISDEELHVRHDAKKLAEMIIRI